MRQRIKSFQSFGILCVLLLIAFIGPVNAATPSTPTTLSPGTTNSPGPLTSSATVDFRWAAVPGATKYGIGVKNSKTNTFEVNTTVATNSFKATLSSNSEFRWNVAACNNTTCSSYTQVLYFKTPPVSYSLSISGTGNGTGTFACDGVACSANYPEGRVVTVTANASAGSSFSGWLDCPGSSGNTCKVTFNGSKSIKANFNLVTANYSLSLIALGSGSGTFTCDVGVCGTSYPAGKSITVAANASTGSSFVSWTDCPSQSGNICKITVSGPKSIKATFNRSTVNYSLSITSIGSGAGTFLCDGVTCNASYPEGKVITVTANPAIGSTFGTWSDCPAASANTCKITVNASKTIKATFNSTSTVAYQRMSTDVKHLGIHVYAYRKNEAEIISIAQNIKKAVFGNISAKTSYEGKGQRAQLAVQVEITPNQFSEGSPEAAYKQIEMIINTFSKEGFAVHLLLNAHDRPVDGWQGISWSKQVWEGTNWNMPYQPCRYSERPGKKCLYDIIFKNFHEPLIGKMVETGLTKKLALIYILNEFDYKYDEEKKFTSAPWSAIECGPQTDWQLCRAEALSYTAQRGFEIANAAAKGTVPIGVKFEYFHPQSGWNVISKNDQFASFLGGTLGSGNGVLGYDCYWHDSDEKRSCGKDRERIVQILESKKLLDTFKNGRIELSEYGIWCEGGVNSFTNDKNGKPNGRFTAPSDMVNIVKDWPVASGFNLFAFNADGAKDGCYAVAYKQSSAIINRFPNAISGLRDQINLITGQ